MEEGLYWMEQKKRPAVENIFMAQAGLEQFSPSQDLRNKKTYPSFGEPQKNKGESETNYAQSRSGFCHFFTCIFP